MTASTARSPAPAARIATAFLVSAGLWTAVNLLVLSNVLDPLPDGVGAAFAPLFLIGALAAGMAAGTPWVALLAVVPPIVANAVGFYDDMREPIPFAELGIPVWAVLLVLGALIGRGLPARVVRASVMGVAAIVALAAVAAGFRTLWPKDAGPPGDPIAIDLAAGRAGTVSLGDGFPEAATRLQAARYRQGAGTRYREPVPGTDLPGQVALEVPYSVARGTGVTLIGHRGAVTAILLTSRDAQTSTGIGVGDNLALVRRREAGARCERDWQFDRPQCVVNRGGRLAVFAGDPIAVIALTVPAAPEATPPAPAGIPPEP